jgi:HlyD family secretion protein
MKHRLALTLTSSFLLLLFGQHVLAADKPPLRLAGTIQSRDMIFVGSEATGRIKSFGDDANGKNEPIAVNSRVKKGDVLAVVDQPSAQRAVLRAKARLQIVRLEIELAKAQFALATNDFDRTKLRAANKSADEADLNVAKSAVDVAHAKIELQEANYEARKVDLDAAQEDLDRCVIRSPIDGIVLDRNVRLGQPVVDSLNQPTLFLIGDPRFQVYCTISEAEIGRIKAGQKIRFTVDALPGKEFTGQIDKIRVDAIKNPSAVTFTAEIDIDGSQEGLLPYMTANVEFSPLATTK